MKPSNISKDPDMQLLSNNTLSIRVDIMDITYLSLPILDLAAQFQPEVGRYWVPRTVHSYQRYEIELPAEKPTQSRLLRPFFAITGDFLVSWSSCKHSPANPPPPKKTLKSL